MIADENSIVIIPFIVLKELDKLKMRADDSVSSNAKRAIRYIYQNLKDEHRRFVGMCAGNHSNDAMKHTLFITVYCLRYFGYVSLAGQSATEDRRHIIDVDSPDDRILNCCIQLKDNHNLVSLLSSDKNLCCKAKSSGINIVTPRECNEHFDTQD